MKKSKKILLKWAATYGEDENDVKATMWNEDMMIEFAKYYHKQKLTLTDVSQQRELLKAYAELIQGSYTHHFFDDAVEESIDKFLSL
mgnify:CR=1 FL=1